MVSVLSEDPLHSPHMRLQTLRQLLFFHVNLQLFPFLTAFSLRRIGLLGRLRRRSLGLLDAGSFRLCAGLCLLLLTIGGFGSLFGLTGRLLLAGGGRPGHRSLHSLRDEGVCVEQAAFGLYLLEHALVHFLVELCGYLLVLLQTFFFFEVFDVSQCCESFSLCSGLRFYEDLLFFYRFVPCLAKPRLIVIRNLLLFTHF